MKTLEKKTKTATAVTTTIELDANLVAKARASLVAIRRNQTLEEFFDDELTDILTPENGFFSGLISTCDDHRRLEMEAKLARIWHGEIGTSTKTTVAVTIPNKVSAMFKNSSVTPEQFVNDMLKAVFATTDLREVIDDLYPKTGTTARIEGLFVVGGKD